NYATNFAAIKKAKASILRM
ncbi:hypothetical protein BMETH_2881621036, partial [methanotrophic bacterial endosymbiont of Bathymodiolus sp.]